MKYEIEAIECSINCLVEKYNSNNGAYADIVWSFCNDYRQAVLDGDPRKDKARYIVHSLSQGLATNYKTLIWCDMFVTSPEIKNCWRNGGPVFPIMKEIPNALLDRGFPTQDVLGAVRYTGYESHRVDEIRITDAVDFFFEGRDSEIDNDDVNYVDELQAYFVFLMDWLNEPDKREVGNKPALVFLCLLLLSGQIRNFKDLVGCGVFYGAHVENHTPFYAIFNGQSNNVLTTELIEKAINPFKKIDENITECVNGLWKLTFERYKSGIWEEKNMFVSNEELLAVQGTPVIVPFELPYKVKAC